MKWWLAFFVVVWLSGGVMSAIEMPNTAKALTYFSLGGIAFMAGAFFGRELGPQRPKVKTGGPHG